jgi:hypothetical protein
MAVYRFKVYFEEDENIIREIEIKSTQTFEDFHKIIQTAIGFDGVHPTSFYVSNDSWRRGKEIILLHKSHNKGLKGTWMHETRLAAYMEDPHQKFVYEFDPDGGNWILMAELMKIIPEASVTYPRINKSTGASPQQYKITSPAEIPPVEDEEEVIVEDDAEDAYVHPEVAEHQNGDTDEEEVGSISRNLVKDIAIEIPDEEAVEEAIEDEMADDEDESAEQEDFS